MKNVSQPLLGWPAIRALNILTIVNTIFHNKNSIKTLFTEVFSGLGKLRKLYAIKLKPEAESFRLRMPRRIPLPLEKAARSELKSMEEQSVISRVEKPTNWCSGMVVVPKSNGKVRICVDFTKLNENACRELHMLPT